MKPTSNNKIKPPKSFGIVKKFKKWKKENKVYIKTKQQRYKIEKTK